LEYTDRLRAVLFNPTKERQEEMNAIINEELARKVLEVVDQGLVKGVGDPKPGQMCVEAAVCYAMGLPHGDEPTCVGYAVRAFKIRLNDADWSSDAARAKGMRQLAVAQLGSDEVDQLAFVREVTLETVRQIVPIALRAAASLNAKHKDALESAAVACEAATDLVAAKAAAAAAHAAAADTDAYAYAYAYAAAAADTAAYAYAAAAHAAAAHAHAAAAAATAAYAAAAHAAAVEKDSVLKRCAKIGLQALIKLGAPGVAFLTLCGDDEE
jgi:hypothetical protein